VLKKVSAEEKKGTWGEERKKPFSTKGRQKTVRPVRKSQEKKAGILDGLGEGVERKRAVKKKGVGRVSHWNLG